MQLQQENIKIPHYWAYVMSDGFSHKGPVNVEIVSKAWRHTGVGISVSHVATVVIYTQQCHLVVITGFLSESRFIHLNTTHCYSISWK